MSMKNLVKLGNNKFINYFIFFIIFFLPFQNLGVGFGQAKNYDISYFLIYLLFINLFLKNIKFSYIIFISIFFLVNFYLFISNFYFNYLEIPHYMSYNEYKIYYKFILSILTINVYFLIFFYHTEINIDYEKIFVLFILILLILLLTMIYMIIKNNFDFSLRYKATFNEPAYAGLFFYSSSLALFFTTFYESNYFNKVFCGCLGLFIFFLAFISKSLHIVSFFVSFFFILFFLISNKFKILIFIFSIIVLIFIFQIDFINDKFNLESLMNLDKLNYNWGNRFASEISFYVWIQNFEQYFHSFFLSPILGLGAGSIGFFKFDSLFFNLLNFNFITTLNLNDGYSLFLYLSIQYGLIFVLPLLFFLVLKSRQFIKENLSNKNEINNKYIFFFVFSLTCIIGSLLKEPNLSRSTIIFSFLIFTKVIYDYKKST